MRWLSRPITYVLAGLGLILTAFLSGLFEPVGTRVLDWVAPQPDYRLSIESCAEEGATPYLVDAAGHEFDLSDQLVGGQLLRHRIRLINTGREPIINQTLGVALMPTGISLLDPQDVSELEPETRVLDLIVFFSTPMRGDAVAFDPGSRGLLIRLDLLNPQDSIDIMYDAGAPTTASFFLHMPRLTFDEQVEPTCSSPQLSQVGGVLAYRFTDAACEAVDYPHRLAISCEPADVSFRVPENAAAGDARIEWRRP